MKQILYSFHNNYFNLTLSSFSAHGLPSTRVNCIIIILYQAFCSYIRVAVCLPMFFFHNKTNINTNNYFMVNDFEAAAFTFVLFIIALHSSVMCFRARFFLFRRATNDNLIIIMTILINNK